MQTQLILLMGGFCAAMDSVTDHGEPRYRVSAAGASGQKLAKQWNVQALPAKGEGRSGRYNHITVSPEIELPVRDSETEHYSGSVFNLEVEEDHTYCVPFIAHNCWVEKDALVGILEKACRPLDVDYFSCRGYTSQSAVYRAAKRFISYFEAGQQPVIIHLGDHDPSGMDMTRDIFDRLEMMVTQQTGHELTVERVALNMNQIVQYHPPPNPAKVTDSRYEGYRRKWGEESWELDSMEPSVIDKLITDTVLKYRDEAQWEKDNATEEKHREQLGSCAHNWAHVSQFVDKPGSYLKMDDVMSIERSAGPALKKELHGLLDGGDEKRPVIVYDRGLSIEVPVANFRHILKATRKKKPSKKKPK